MKKIVLSVVVCLFVAFMNSCEKNDREYYDTGFSAINIWVGAPSIAYESITYNFIAHKDMDAVTFYARISGVATDYDRSFKLKAVGGHISKVDFHLEDEYIVPAGEYEVSFPIYFGKPDNYDEFRYSDGYLVFTVESDDFAEGSFSAGGIDMRRLYIVFQNSVAKPDNWDSESGQYLKISTYFGSYSNAKYEFMIGVMGFMGFKIFYGSDLTDLESNVITYIQAQYYASRCKTALANFNADADNIASGKAPLMDEFGFQVKFN